MAAEALGIRFEDIVVTGDTELGTFDLGSFASRVTYAPVPLLRKRQEEINQKVEKLLQGWWAAGRIGWRSRSPVYINI